MVNDSAINYQNILLDEPINITFSTTSSLNSLVTRGNTSFIANDSHIKNMIRQTALDHLKRQILTEVLTQEIKNSNISKCNTSSTPNVISSLKCHIQALESGIHFVRSELQKNALVKSLVTSNMLYENVHITYENVEKNPRISPSKIIGTSKFCSSDQVSNSDDVIDFHINYEQVPRKDAKFKDQANLLKHDVQSETSNFSVTDETKNNKKTIIKY